jgi:flavodoxin
MKILISVSSKTGNTRKVAEAIHATLPEAELHNIENAPDPNQFDLIFMGFWVDKGTADEKTQEYVQKINNKTVAIFGTLGAYPDSQHAEDSLKNVAKLLPNCHIIDHYLCQGSIDPKLIEWMSSLPAEHPHAPDTERRKRWENAAQHPDDNDCRTAANWAVTVLQKATSKTTRL